MEQEIKKDMESSIAALGSGKGYSKQTVKVKNPPHLGQDDVMSINSSVDGGDHGKGFGEL